MEIGCTAEITHPDLGRVITGGGQGAPFVRGRSNCDGDRMATSPLRFCVYWGL